MSAILSDDEDESVPLSLKNLSVGGQSHKNEADIVAGSLVGVVDIGSNGIRFSISSVAHHHARTTPCVFKDRLNVSLFEAQYESGNSKINEKSPIPNEVIYEVCRAMKRFQIICADFGVDDKSVRVVATEATREAKNSQYFRECINKTTGWRVELLSKEDEGKMGSYGVVSSFHGVRGLFMDLGGGSVQINWIYTEPDGTIEFAKKPISLPYGAAALTRRLRSENKLQLFIEIKEAFANAVSDLKLPQKLLDMAKTEDGFQLYCSGGGLRGLGHLLLSQDPDYPITAVVNGFTCSFNQVESMANYLFLKDQVPNGGNSIFRVSKRRKQQFPAIGLLISAAFESLPKIRSVSFSEGGVREGALFEMLPRISRGEDPLIVATSIYKPLLVDKYLTILRASLPKEYVPKVVYDRVAPALCNLAFVHSSYPKELQPTAALHVATSGIIAGTHGLSHSIRALINIALCERWGAELPTNQLKFKNRLIQVIENGSAIDSADIIFWTIYIGKIMFFICGIHPGGNINEVAAPFEFKVKSKEFEEESNTGKTKHKFETVVRIDPENLKIGSGAGSRVKSIQKKMKKLSKTYNVKLKFEIQSFNSMDAKQELRHGEREDDDEEEEEGI